MKNPLIRRLPRELKDDIGKYIVILLLLILSIGFVSGFLVADGSLINCYDESFEKYNIENGNFETISELTEEQIKAIEKLGIRLYNNNYVEEEISNNKTVRIFANRKEVNKVCLMEGKLPDKKDEIALDRMFAENNDIAVGDSIKISGNKKKVTGYVALSDYSTLFSDNSDTMFDSVNFSVAIVTKEEFESYGTTHYHYSYSWKYHNDPKDDSEEKEISDDLLAEINSISALQNFLPRYANQAITFAREDMGGDKAMMMMLLYIIIAILAFVFAVTISNTITKEANTIGTLRASGYKKSELVRYYIAMPMIITVTGALIGNILGYTVFKDLCAAMYYGSYSLLKYETIWNAEAFILTTVIPLIIMFLITLIVLINKLSLSPLKFIRRDLKRHQRKKAFKLNTKLRIFTRFRIRIIFQNISNYITLFVGIIFANLLLMFGLALPDVLNNYQEDITSNMICDYQYVLKAPAETEETGVEKFSLTSLQSTFEGYDEESISVYGIEKNSSYINVDTSDNKVYISDGFADKYSIEIGDKITLQDKYSKEKYCFEISGVYDYPGSLSIFTDIDRFNKIFELDKDSFTGYFSNKEITDIDETFIATVIDKETLTKVSRQLDVSMGNMMYLVDGFAIIIFVILIYLLSKIVIEKNASSISMTKILGYTNGEISKLYIASTLIIVVLCLIISIPFDYWLLKYMFKTIMMSKMSGWIPLDINPIIFAEMLILGIVAYFAVSVLEYRKIGKVPLGEALKNAE